MNEHHGPPIIEMASPVDQFLAWLGEAESSEPNDPNAMALEIGRAHV